MHGVAEEFEGIGGQRLAFAPAQVRGQRLAALADAGDRPAGERRIDAADAGEVGRHARLEVAERHPVDAGELVLGGDGGGDLVQHLQLRELRLQVGFHRLAFGGELRREFHASRTAAVATADLRRH